jgi:hypothetical protein
MRMTLTIAAVFATASVSLPMTSSIAGEQVPLTGILRQEVQGADTCMYLVSGGKQYLLDAWRDAEAGDCVSAGLGSGSCNSQCNAHDGCRHVEFLVVTYGCVVAECGRLVLGLGECTYFESANLGKYLLSNQGSFGVGDSITVSGTVEWCMTECLDTHRCIVVDQIAPCGASPVQITTWGQIRARYR